MAFARHKKNCTIGILALQGDFFEHENVLDKIGIKTKRVTQPDDLTTINGIILPGGESTVMAKLLDRTQLRAALKEKINSGLPAWGTCAGLILLANTITSPEPVPLRCLDIAVDRNAYGRQVDSFEEQISDCSVVPDFGAVYIRAPRITTVGAAVRVLARRRSGEPIAVQQNSIIGTTFHPELTSDLRWHEYFVSLVNR